jgi:hypothetical protein
MFTSKEKGGDVGCILGKADPSPFAEMRERIRDDQCGRFTLVDAVQ